MGRCMRRQQAAVQAKVAVRLQATEQVVVVQREEVA